MKKQSRYNNEFELVELTIQKNFRDVQIPEISTETKYISLSAAIHGKFAKDDKNLNVGAITVFVDTLSQLLMIENDNQFLSIMHEILDNSEVIQKAIGGVKAMTGKGRYIPLAKYSGALHGEEFDLVVVSAAIENSMFEQLKYIDINDARNLRALVRDLNDCGRMYQELTLDAAKKLYKVITSFYQEFVRAESTIHLDHTPVNFRQIIESTNINGDIANPFSVFRIGNEDIDMEIEVGNYNTKITAQGQVKTIFKDHLAEIQNSNIAAIEKVVNVTGVKGYKQTKLSEQTIKDLDILGNNKDLAKDLVELIVTPYHHAIKVKTDRLDKLNYRKLSKNAKRNLRHTIIKEIDEDYRLTPQAKNKKLEIALKEFDEIISLSDFEAAARATSYEEKFKETVDELSNLARFYTKDLSIVQAGRALFTASHIKVNGADNSVTMREVPSKAYLNIAPELAFAYITATQGDMKVCGYPLCGKTELVNEEDVLEFSCGVCTNVEGVYVNSAYTGTLKVQTVNDVISAVVDIAELLEANRIQPVTPKRLYVKLLNSKTYDVNRFLTEKTVNRLGSFYEFDRQGGFNRANELTLLPRFRSVNKYNKNNRIEFNVIVGNVPSFDNPSITVQAPLCGYSTYSSQLENILAGLTVKSILKVQTSEKAAIGVIEFGDNPTYIEVEKNKVDNLIDDIFGPVSDIDSNANAFVNSSYMDYIDAENLDEIEQQLRSMGLTLEDLDRFGDIPNNTDAFASDATYSTVDNGAFAPTSDATYATTYATVDTNAFASNSDVSDSTVANDAFAPNAENTDSTSTAVSDTTAPDAFAPTSDATEKTQTVEKSTKPEFEFDDEINSALERLGIDVQTLSDFSAFK